MYLYHHVPNDQDGDVIYPLNVLRDKFPELYIKHFAKYDDIQEKDVEIPGFGYWNDCINLMPVKPSLVKAELQKYGHDTDWPWRFYKIDATTLDNSKLVILVMDEQDGMLHRTFVPFNQQTFDEYCHIGDATRAAFQKAKDAGEQPNTFARIPHVLYKDSIHTTNLQIVDF